MGASFRHRLACTCQSTHDPRSPPCQAGLRSIYVDQMFFTAAHLSSCPDMQILVSPPSS